MNYKVTGNTARGVCACGHRVGKGEEYIIARLKQGLTSLCLKCRVKYNVGQMITIKAEQVSGIK